MAFTANTINGVVVSQEYDAVGDIARQVVKYEVPYTSLTDEFKAICCVAHGAFRAISAVWSSTLGVDGDLLAYRAFDECESDVTGLSLVRSFPCDNGSPDAELVASDIILPSAAIAVIPMGAHMVFGYKGDSAPTGGKLELWVIQSR
jgi:hypothetical protein